MKRSRIIFTKRSENRFFGVLSLQSAILSSIWMKNFSILLCRVVHVTVTHGIQVTKCGKKRAKWKDTTTKVQRLHEIACSMEMLRNCANGRRTCNHVVVSHVGTAICAVHFLKADLLDCACLPHVTRVSHMRCTKTIETNSRSPQCRVYSMVKPSGLVIHE